MQEERRRSTDGETTGQGTDARTLPGPMSYTGPLGGRPAAGSSSVEVQLDTGMELIRRLGLKGFWDIGQGDATGSPLEVGKQALVAYGRLMSRLLRPWLILSGDDEPKVSWRRAYRDGTKALSENIFHDAVEAFDRVITVRPNDARAYNARGYAHLALSQMGVLKDELALAKADFSQATTLNPRDREFHHNLGKAQYLNSDYHLAVDEFETAFGRGSKDPILCSNLGNTYLMLGEREQALEKLSLSVKLDPRNARTHKLLGDAYIFDQDERTPAGRQEWKKAEEAFERAIELDDNYDQAKGMLDLVRTRLHYSR